MIIINFAHPLTEANFQEIKALTNMEIHEVREMPMQIDVMKPLTPQIEETILRVGLTPQQWQTTPLLVNLPSLNYSTAALLVILHGLTGHFPAVLRLRPKQGNMIPQFEVAEIINLQEVREKCRLLR